MKPTFDYGAPLLENEAKFQDPFFQRFRLSQGLCSFSTRREDFQELSVSDFLRRRHLRDRNLHVRSRQGTSHFASPENETGEDDPRAVCGGPRMLRIQERHERDALQRDRDDDPHHGRSDREHSRPSHGTAVLQEIRALRFRNARHVEGKSASRQQDLGPAQGDPRGRYLRAGRRLRGHRQRGVRDSPMSSCVFPCAAQSRSST